jgi:hypothetical protein
MAAVAFWQADALQLTTATFREELSRAKHRFRYINRSLFCDMTPPLPPTPSSAESRNYDKLMKVSLAATFTNVASANSTSWSSNRSSCWETQVRTLPFLPSVRISRCLKRCGEVLPDATVLQWDVAAIMDFDYWDRLFDEDDSSGWEEDQTSGGVYYHYLSVMLFVLLVLFM